MKPIIIELEINDEPPYDINGNVIPLVGRIFRLEEILIIAWNTTILIKPMIEFKIKKFVVLCAIIKIRK